MSVSVVAGFWNAYFWSLLPLVVWAAAEKNADTWLCVAISNRMTHLNTVSLVGRRLIALAVMIALMDLWGNGAIAYTGGVALGAIISSVFAHFVIKPILGVTEGSGEYKCILRQARPYWIHSFATQIRNLDTVLVALMASPVIAGYYGVASKLAGPLRMVPTSMAPVLVPEVVRHGISRKVLGAIGVVVLLMTTIYFGLSFTASLWVPYVFGSDYEHAVSAVQAMCIGLVFGATATLLGASLQAAGA
ncbi:TPA: oligosaccharide flippase family protein, partial [Shigella flexneri]|nr:oligosaccharide flippase family protein [Shigella flexneri]